ncbi:MAG: hypothetical protein ACP5U0_08980 [Caldisphaera sp.]
MIKQTTAFKSIIFAAVVLIAVAYFYFGVLSATSNINGHNSINSNKLNSSYINKNVSKTSRPVYKTTIFDVVNPYNVLVIINYSNLENSSTGSVITFNTTYGTYSYSASILAFSLNSSNCRYSITPVSGSLSAGSSTSLVVSESCITTFTESGLPSGTTWNITYGNQVYTSSDSTISISSGPGTFTWEAYGLDYSCIGGIVISCLYEYSPSPSSGSLTAGENQTIFYN